MSVKAGNVQEAKEAAGWELLVEEAGSFEPLGLVHCAELPVDDGAPERSSSTRTLQSPVELS